MFTLKRLIASTLFVVFLAVTALAQESRSPVDTPREPVASGPLVTAAATAKRVRFVSPGSVVQLRLEVYNEAGQKLFDTELRGGNVLDWHLQDGAGERLAAGSYACLLTSKSLSGRLSQRVGLVTVSDQKVVIETAGGTQLSIAQQQTIGPVEGNAAFTILTEARPSGRAQTDSIQKPPQESEAEAITTVTHDGNDGQMARTRGALSFRVGDLFDGKDKEQMRLTQDGRLGIGTSNPQANLDVAGTIRTGEGLIFSDGSTLKVNEKGVLTRTNADGSPKSITATTQNQIAKFTDNLGTVGDSVITESPSGFIGIGTNSPQSLLQVGNNTGYGTTTGLLITNNLIGTQYDRAFQLAPRQTANPASNSVLMYALPTVNTGVTVPSQYGLFVDGKQGPGTITSYAAIATGQLPSMGAANNTHLLLGNLSIPAGNFAVYDNTNYKSFFSGNVGIGTINPTQKLDVFGDINTSTQYRIGGNRVFSIPGNNNTFAGLNVGAANTTGAFNSFFGSGAGFFNTTGQNNSFFGIAAGFRNNLGEANSFFGVNAGLNNTAGTGNSFFGVSTGASNTTENNNTLVGSGSNGQAGITNATAVGYLAKVTQSNSLVLGSINTVNGATADTNVGIGTTAPAERLSVAGVIQSTTGGFKFPDGSVQTTAVGGANTIVSTVPFQLPQSSFGSVIHLDLPAGTYLLTTTVEFFNTANTVAADNGRFFECRFTGDQIYINSIPGASNMTLTHHSVLNITSGMDLNCRAYGTDRSIFASTRRFTAVRIPPNVVVQ